MDNKCPPLGHIPRYIRPADILKLYPFDLVFLSTTGARNWYVLFNFFGVEFGVHFSSPPHHFPPGRETDYSPPASGEVMNDGAIPPLVGW
jgi:hypothetical protein